VPGHLRHLRQGPQVTSEAFDGGWLRTGVLGRTDDEGFLFIADRKEDQIITASGKNAAPTMLEDRLREHWLIGECVVGDQRRQIAALVTLDLGVRLVQAAGRLASRHVQQAAAHGGNRRPGGRQLTSGGRWAPSRDLCPCAVRHS